MAEYIRAGWDARAKTSSIYIEAVHRLSDLGAVVTHAAYGTSQEGFEAEWRMVRLLTVDRRHDQPLPSFSTRQTSTLRSRGSSS